MAFRLFFLNAVSTSAVCFAAGHCKLYLKEDLLYIAQNCFDVLWAPLNIDWNQPRQGSYAAEEALSSEQQQEFIRKQVPRSPPTPESWTSTLIMLTPKTRRGWRSLPMACLLFLWKQLERQGATCLPIISL